MAVVVLLLLVWMLLPVSSGWWGAWWCAPPAVSLHVTHQVPAIRCEPADVHIRATCYGQHLGKGMVGRGKGVVFKEVTVQCAAAVMASSGCLAPSWLLLAERGAHRLAWQLVLCKPAALPSLAAEGTRCWVRGGLCGGRVFTAAAGRAGGSRRSLHCIHGSPGRTASRLGCGERERPWSRAGAITYTADHPSWNGFKHVSTHLAF